MALTNRGSKWESKNSLYVLLAFIPVVNCMAFFHMSSRVKNKKWSILGWVTLFLSLALLLLSFISFTIQYDSPVQVDFSTAPQVSDYLGNKFYEIDNYMDTPEYKQYEEDYEAWKNLPETVAAREAQNQWADRWNAVFFGASAAYGIFYIVIVFFVFIERPKYIVQLAKQTNKNQAFSQMQFGNTGTPPYPQANAAPHPDLNGPAAPYNGQANTATTYAQPQPGTAQAPTFAASQGTDINTADEAQLAALPGLTVIDAKKAITYREENAAFRSVDEFFSVIQAKPHIIARLQPLLYVGTAAQSPAAPQSGSKRRIDF